jgi:hypothetical protein
MKITDEIVQAVCNAYDNYNKEHGNVLLRGVATGHGMKAALEAAIQAAWINVSERLPEPVYVDGTETYKEYLIYDTLNNKVSHDYFHSSHGWNYYHSHVTHWMELPEYKGT